LGDAGLRERGLGDGLAAAGRADDQRVDSLAHAEGNPADAAPPCRAEREPVSLHAPLCQPAALDERPCPAKHPERVADLGRLLAAALGVLKVPVEAGAGVRLVGPEGSKCVDIRPTPGNLALMSASGVAGE
jgi:hypothetical protein